MDPRGASASQAQVEAFGRRHRTGLVTLVFTDMVGSTALKQQLGDHAGAQLLERHHGLVRSTLAEFPEGQELSTAGDSFFLVFATPSAGVKFALILQQRLRELSRQAPVAVQDRLGLHLGEVLIQEPDQQRTKDLIGLNVDLGARVMGLAQGGQILLTRAVFDSARQALKGEDIPGVGPLNWLNHGLYQLKGIEEPVEVCEVGEVGKGPLHSPATTEKARRVEGPEGEAVLGWRPAVGQVVPNTQWVLEKKLGEGGFGEVWLGRHQTMKERRVFKFCFRADRVRSLKREMTLFRLIRERIGDHPHIVGLREVYFDQPPFYVEMEYVAGQDLRTWCEGQGGAAKVPLEVRLEIVAQIADALQAAHDAGVIHRDVKPGNILVSGQWSVVSGQKEAGHSSLSAKLTDFGIGQVVSEEALRGVTKAGFTQTIIADSSSSHTGSQLYLAPELLAGKPASIRSDIYSLGVVLYQLLAGDLQRPVTTDWARHIADPLLRGDLEQCFAGDPEERFMGAGQLAKNLRLLPQRQAALAERERLERNAARRRVIAVVSAGVAVVLLLLALALGYGLKRADHQRHRAEAGERLAAQRAYDSDINLAQRALAEFNLGRALELLDRHRPSAKSETRNPKSETDLRGWEWRYLWKQSCGTGSKILMTSTNPICALALSSDGRWLAVREWRPAAGASPSDRITLWDLPARRRVGEVRSKGWHRSLAISTSLNLIAAPEFERSGPDQTFPVRLWDLTTLKEKGRLPHPDKINCLALSPDGRQLATHANDEKLRLWDLATQQEIKRFPASKAQEPTWFLGGLLFSSDGNRLVFGDSLSRSNRVIDLRTGQELTITPPVGEGDAGVAVIAMALSPDGRRLAVGYGFSTSPIDLVDLDTGTCLHKLTGHRAFLSCLCFTPDGRTLASAAADQTIRLWDVESGHLTRILTGHTELVSALAASLDGSGLVSGSADGTVRIWKLPRPETNADPVALEVRCQPFLRSFAFLPDSRSFVALDTNGTAVIRDVLTGAEEERLTGLGTNHNAVALSPDGRWVVVGGLAQHLGVWDRWQRVIVPNTTVQTGDVWAGSFDARGRVLRVLVTLPPTDRAMIILLDTRDWRELRSWHVEQWGWFELAWSPDDRLAALGGADGTVTWWDASTGRELAVTQGPSADATSLAFSPDSRWLTAASWADGRVILWDATTRRVEPPPLRAHLQVAVGVTFSPDGRRLATGGMLANEGIKIWDFETRFELLTLATPTDFAGSLAFSPDGNTLASISSRLYLWHAPSWDEIATAEKAKAVTP